MIIKTGIYKCHLNHCTRNKTHSADIEVSGCANMFFCKVYGSPFRSTYRNIRHYGFFPTMSIWCTSAGRLVLELTEFSGGVKYLCIGDLPCAHVKQLLIYTTRSSMKRGKLYFLRNSRTVFWITKCSFILLLWIRYSNSVRKGLGTTNYLW